jgi:hypothetical protein
MPLGLLISNDGIHFREPVPGFVFVPHGQDGQWDQRGLLSGQAFEQMGDETYIWYGNWDLSETSNAKTYGAVGLLTMRRDGFGSVSPMNRSAPAQLITCAIPTRDIGRLAVNAEGLSAEVSLRVELLDELERPLPAYAGENAAVVHEGGVRKPVYWPRGGGVPLLDRPLRIRIRFEGARRDQARLYAIYLDLKEPSA